MYKLTGWDDPFLLFRLRESSHCNVRTFIRISKISQVIIGTLSLIEQNITIRRQR